MIDTSKVISKITYNGQDLPLPDAEAAYESGKQDGIQSEYDRFWDEFQQNGNRVSYQYAFGGAGWTDKTFKPKYNMKPVRSDGMFHTSGLAGDLVEILETCGVAIDLSSCPTVSQTYVYAGAITRVGIQDTRASNSLNMMFYACRKLNTIDRLILKEDGSQTVASVFANCEELENLVIEGKIGQNGFNVQWSTKLTRESLLSIAAALADKTGDTSGTWTITFSNAIDDTPGENKMTRTELNALVYEKGWTTAYA
jgi:hypothetical protein